MPQDVAKWKALLRYITVVSFISIAIVVVKLKLSEFLVLIQHLWSGPFLDFFVTLLPQILFNLAEILNSGSLQ